MCMLEVQEQKVPSDRSGQSHKGLEHLLLEPLFPVFFLDDDTKG